MHTRILGEGLGPGRGLAVSAVGLGAMGAPMIGHLLDAGHEIAVHVRRREAATALLARGARYAASPAEAASGAVPSVAGARIASKRSNRGAKPALSGAICASALR